MAINREYVLPRTRQRPFFENGPWTVTVLLCAAMTFAVVQSVAMSNWAAGLSIMAPVTLGGVLVGAIFSRLRWLPDYLANFLSALLGGAWMVQLVGPQMGRGLPTWRDHAIDLLIRTIIASRLYTQGGTGDDLVLFVALLAAIGWLLGYLSVYALTRHGWAWWVVLLNAVVLFVNLTYASPKPPIGLFFLYVGAALLVIVQQTFLQRARTWTAAQIEFPDFLGWRFVASGLLVVLVVLIATTILPTHITTSQVVHVWDQVRSPWQKIQARWDRTFSNINAPANAVGGGFSGTSFTLGGARTLGTELVMEVQSPRFDYWRATAYDRYDGRLSWPNTTGDLARAALGKGTAENALTALAANQTVPQLDTAGRIVISQTFTLQQSLSIPTLFAATQPMAWSIPTLVQHTFLQANGATVPNYTDTALVQAQTSLSKGTSYTVQSLVSDVDKGSLRAAPTQYPQWVSRYLQLPPTLPQRLRTRSDEVVRTANAANPYDKAEAIQNYLRTFPYDEKIPSPPDDRDVVDYFVFDLQRGYCDYFASAMVVMLRTQGIPARIAQGYAGGTYNDQTGLYDVHQNLAHTWPEVYFPGYGWQRFEPTPASYAQVPQRAEAPGGGNAADARNAQGRVGHTPDDAAAELERQLNSQGANLTRDANKDALDAANAARTQRVRLEQRGAIGTAVVLTLLLGLWFYRRPLKLLPAAAVYNRVLRWGRLAGVRAAPSSTPHEFASRLGRHMPAQRTSLQSIADAYTREQYARASEPAPALDQAWRALRAPFIRAIIARFTHQSGEAPRADASRRQGS